MKLCRLSSDVFGFETFEGCKAYFENVLPWNGYIFPIIGSGPHVKAEETPLDETLLFTYCSRIIAIAKLDEKVYEMKNTAIMLENSKRKVKALKLVPDSLKVFQANIKLNDLQKHLQTLNYNKAINGTQGWNVFPIEIEKGIIDFLLKKEWHHFI